MAIRPDRERPKKILVAMYRLASRPWAYLSYEDIVVQAFRMFPDDFSLRGFPEYPDSSDVHKPLYGTLAKKGLVKSSEKRFALTEQGLAIANALAKKAGDKLDLPKDPDRLTRNQNTEIARMMNSPAFQFYSAGKQQKILDSDMLTFFGSTIRARGSHFVGRVATCTQAINDAVAHGRPTREDAQVLKGLLAFLLERFATEISLMRKMKSA
jgi:hypothetical protein